MTDNSNLPSHIVVGLLRLERFAAAYPKLAALIHHVEFEDDGDVTAKTGHNYTHETLRQLAFEHQAAGEWRKRINYSREYDYILKTDEFTLVLQGAEPQQLVAESARIVW